MRWLFLGSSGMQSVLGVFSPDSWGGRASSAKLPDGTDVYPEELRVATDNLESEVVRVDRSDGVDYGFNVLGVEYLYSGDGPFYYLLERNITNLFSNPTSPATQSIHPIGAQYTFQCWGAGSIVLSGNASGTVTEGNPVTVTTTGSAVTATVTGCDLIQCETGSEATTFTPTTRTADAAIVRANVIPADNSQIKYIDSGGNIQTDNVFGSEISGNWTGLSSTVSESGEVVSVSRAGGAPANITAIKNINVSDGNTYVVTGEIEKLSGNFSAMTIRQQYNGTIAQVTDDGLFSALIVLNGTTDDLHFYVYDTACSFNLVGVSVQSIHPLCLYDPDTQELSVRHDTDVNAKIILG